jgi:sulfite exporter TauE/SafE
MESLPLLSLFLMGLAYGGSACLLSCAPALAPLLVNRGESLGGSVRMLGLFGAGRITAYALISALAATASLGVRSFLEDPALTRPVTGTVLIATALWLLYRQWKPAPPICAAGRLSREKLGAWGAAGIFLTGMALSLNLCAPILSLIAVSAASRSTLYGALYGILFGLGTVTVMLLLYGAILAPVTRELLAQFQRQKAAIQATASLLLLGAGAMVLLGRLQL